MSAVLDTTIQSIQLSKIEATFAIHQATKLKLRHSTVEQRIEKLKNLRQALLDNEAELCEAAYADFKKPEAEFKLVEIFPVTSGITHIIANLKQWMKPKKVKTPMTLMGTKSEIRYEPKGSSLIISPWNYPAFLTFGPLSYAIASGNTVILKPSEMTPHLSRAMVKVIEQVFDEDEVAIFEGATDVSTALLELPFDHIFFTGSPQIGKVVMAAAAKHLTSVTLELGGKSPVIIDETAHLPSAAKRICWGKFVNCGQTCIAPDYVLIHESQKEAFIAECKQVIEAAYKANGSAKASEDFARIVNNRHFQRIKALLDNAVEQGATVAIGGETVSDENYIEPTLLTDVTPTMAIMEEEIFGPLLPILTYTDLDQALAMINSRHKPLALYAYSKNGQTVEKILTSTSAGGTCINDNLLHALHPYLPFGGTNNSGLGKTHGYAGFLAFTHDRAVLRQPRNFSSTQLLFPPYTSMSKKIIGLTQKFFG